MLEYNTDFRLDTGFGTAWGNVRWDRIVGVGVEIEGEY